MKYGWIISNLLDMRVQASFHSERVNQLLFGALVDIIREKSGYLYVKNQEGYTGWVLATGIIPLTKADFESWKKKPVWVIKANILSVYRDTNKAVNVYPYQLFYGTKLSGTITQQGWFKIATPHGKRFYVRSRMVDRVPKIKPKIAPPVLLKEGLRFLGLPYLWGGVSTPGFDCSGFVQTLYGRFGINLPRDTKDQISVGEPIERNDVKKGDLMFFDRHVGIAFDRNTLLHCSVSGNGVQLESLNKNDHCYRKDLDESFKIARRVR